MTGITGTNLRFCGNVSYATTTMTAEVVQFLGFATTCCRTLHYFLCSMPLACVYPESEPGRIRNFEVYV